MQESNVFDMDIMDYTIFQTMYTSNICTVVSFVDFILKKVITDSNNFDKSTQQEVKDDTSIKVKVLIPQPTL